MLHWPGQHWPEAMHGIFSKNLRFVDCRLWKGLGGASGCGLHWMKISVMACSAPECYLLAGMPHHPHGEWGAGTCHILPSRQAQESGPRQMLVRSCQEASMIGLPSNLGSPSCSKPAACSSSCSHANHACGKCNAPGLTASTQSSDVICSSHTNRGVNKVGLRKLDAAWLAILWNHHGGYVPRRLSHSFPVKPIAANQQG